MPQIIPAQGKKLTNTTVAGKAAALAASNLSGQDIDPMVQRPFAIDPSEIDNQAALEAISASTQQPQTVVAAPAVVVPVGTATGNGQDVVEGTALLVELHTKIDQLLHKRGLCESDHEDDDDAQSDSSVSDVSSDEDEEKNVVASSHKASTKQSKQQIAKNVTVKKHVSKKQKLAEELTQELDQQIGGGAVVEQNVVGVTESAIASGSVADLVTKANEKLDKLLADETDSEADEDDDDDEDEIDDSEDENDAEDDDEDEE